ncbi:hypothetical protein VNO78_06584 [Psophocarpus tetragonolobus]|uniref:Uncharacterized protein n=1 Tax=Psophocarpus tetragonolobus TaxID=3891 RepID=A0AAN9SSM6_PSOTE
MINDFMKAKKVKKLKRRMELKGWNSTQKVETEERDNEAVKMITLKNTSPVHCRRGSKSTTFMVSTGSSSC